MPIYEFRCTHCRQEFEELASATASDTPACPSCASPETEKLMSCCHHTGGGGDYDSGGYSPGGGGGGCGGCSGGNCASCH